MLIDADCQPLDLDREQLLGRMWHMQERVAELGLERFDPTDVLSHPLFLSLQLGRRRFNGYYLLRLVEYFSPLLCRRLLGVQPTLTPTTMYHLGLSYLEWETAEPQCSSQLASLADAMCERALQERLPGDLAAWRHPYDMHKGAWARPGLRRKGVPDSCCHHTTRLGRLLLEVGRRHYNERYLRAARSAVDALLTYHNWRHYNNGISAVSYYPDTDDETINTSAEVASLIACLPQELCSDRDESCLHGLLQLVITEQGEAGEWRYASRNHELRMGRGGGPDNHHTAMNLASLADVLRNEVVSGDERRRVVDCLSRGLDFYLENLVRPDGACISEVGGRRCAEIAGYCEGVKMMLSVASLPEFVARQTKLLPYLSRFLSRAFDVYYDRRTGDVGCSRRFGHTYHIGSIRWGAGLLMDATAAALAWEARANSANITGSSASANAAA